MDRNLALELVRVTEAAALASARFMGKGDPDGADRAAASAMELAISGVKITGNIVIGDDRVSDQSKLHQGAVVGSGGDMEVDLLIDPLESRNSLADGQANAISAVALGPRGVFCDLESRYMQKIVVCPEAADAVDLSSSVYDNLVRIAAAKRVYVEDLTVSVLNREKHRGLIAEIRKTGARIELCRDGDLAAAIAAAMPGTGIDVFMGIGDSRQGIIAAAALSCLRAGFQVRFVDEDEPFVDGNGSGKIYNISDLVENDNIMFAVTGVSNSDFLEGVMFRPGGALTHSLVLRGRSGTIRFLKTEHFFDRDPDYT
ncbi:MAG: fructose-bisphosphatase class II family protein [Candidatus Krumholzibacteriota bacterium]|nr:fructose-bisphosphatase class II family protein [Candidatus Krumholzibacteriota bacterium]